MCLFLLQRERKEEGNEWKEWANISNAWTKFELHFEKFKDSEQKAFSKYSKKAFCSIKENDERKVLDTNHKELKVHAGYLSKIVEQLGSHCRKFPQTGFLCYHESFLLSEEKLLNNLLIWIQN